MLDFVSSRDLNWNRFWLSLQHHVETYHVRSPDTEHDFRPGEIAFAKGVVIEDFFNLLEQKGYSLNEEEREWYQRGRRSISVTGKTAKPCIILDRLGSGWYRICHTSSFGGNIRPSQILSPVMRYFGFSMVKGEWPPGEKLLEVSPIIPKTAYAIMIPSVTRDVVPVDWTYRTFLKVGQLERLKKLTEIRIQGFDDVADYLRANNLKYKTTLIKQQTRAMRRLLLDSPYSRRELHAKPFYNEAQFPGSHLLHVLNEGLRRGDRKPVRVLRHKSPSLFVPRPNFISHFHQRTINEVINRGVPMFRRLQQIDPRVFRLPRMLK